MTTIHTPIFKSSTQKHGLDIRHIIIKTLNENSGKIVIIHPAGILHVDSPYKAEDMAYR